VKCGQPLEVELRIAESGEVLYRSPGVFKEYFKNLEATNDTKTADGWVRLLALTHGALHGRRKALYTIFGGAFVCAGLFLSCTGTDCGVMKRPPREFPAAGDR
jgi:acyl-CoA synthetase (AMP-forming)/AMP-acid ligase II